MMTSLEVEAQGNDFNKVNEFFEKIIQILQNNIYDFDGDISAIALTSALTEELMENTEKHTDINQENGSSSIVTQTEQGTNTVDETVDEIQTIEKITENTLQNNNLEGHQMDNLGIALKDVKVISAKDRERPKGANSTVFGLPKKGKDHRSFDKKNSTEKRDIILNWIIEDANSFREKKNIHEDVLKPIEEIDIRILEVNLTIIKKIFPSEIYNILKTLKQNKKKNARWFCSICDEVIASSESVIRCDSCLHWIHMKCDNNNSSSTSTSSWYCMKCK